MYILNMVPQFEWDDSKAALNKIKHGISFEQAITAFEDPEFLDIYDVRHSIYEDRMIRVGQSDAGILAVIYVERENRYYRIISARKASRQERNLYYETQRKNRL
jgi:uncharacterized protein